MTHQDSDILMGQELERKRLTVIQEEVNQEDREIESILDIFAQQHEEFLNGKR